MLIREKDLAALLNIFEKTNLPFEIWAYGSRVSGSAHDASDLDLVLRTNDLTPMYYEHMDEIVERIRDSNIPILVELRDWAFLPESFHQEILSNYEILYPKKMV